MEPGLRENLGGVLGTLNNRKFDPDQFKYPPIFHSATENVPHELAEVVEAL